MTWICRLLCAARKIAYPPASTPARSGGMPGKSNLSTLPRSINARLSCFRPAVSIPCCDQRLVCRMLSMPRIVPEDPMHTSQPSRLYVRAIVENSSAAATSACFSRSRVSSPPGKKRKL